MENVKEVVSFVVENYEQMFIALVSLVAAAEVIVRFTPTKKDDGFVKRLGELIDKAMDALKIPNSADNHKPKK